MRRCNNDDRNGAAYAVVGARSPSLGRRARSTDEPSSEEEEAGGEPPAFGSVL